MPSKKARHSQPDEQLPLGNGSGISDEEMRFRTYAFQQALLQRSCLKEEKARALYTRLTNDTSGDFACVSTGANASLAGVIVAERTRVCLTKAATCRRGILGDGGSLQRQPGLSSA